jgi:hypothetical protein
MSISLYDDRNNPVSPEYSNPCFITFTLYYYIAYHNTIQKRFTELPFSAEVLRCSVCHLQFLVTTVERVENMIIFPAIEAELLSRF